MYVTAKIEIPVVASFNWHKFIQGSESDPGQRESIEIYNIGLVGPKGAIIELCQAAVDDIIRRHWRELEGLARDWLAEIEEVMR